MDRREGTVEVAFPEGDVVFVCRRACERVRYGPVIFRNVDGYKVVMLVEDAN